MADEAPPQSPAPVEQIRTFLRDHDETGARPESLAAARETMRKGIVLMAERNVGKKVVLGNRAAAIILPYISPSESRPVSSDNESLNANAEYSASKPWGAVFIADTGETAFVEPAVTIVDRNIGMRDGKPLIEKVASSENSQIYGFRDWLAGIKNGTILAAQSIEGSFLDAFRAYVTASGQRLTESSDRSSGQNQRDSLDYVVDNALSTAERRLMWQVQSERRDDASAEDAERTRNSLLTANAGKVEAMTERLTALQPPIPPEPTSSGS